MAFPPANPDRGACRRRVSSERPVRRVPIGTALLLACLATTPGASAIPHPAQAPRVQPPVFRSGVDVVVVEATAVDRAGNVATGLGRKDFEVRIGGYPRDVVSVEFVDYDSASRARADADVTTNIERPPSRAVLVVVDQTSLRFENRGVLEGAKRWLATLAPDDRLGFMGLPSPGPIVEFTTDHARVLAAFARLETGAGSLRPPNTLRNVSLWEAFQIVERNDAVRAEVVARECREGDPYCPGEVFDNARSIVVDSQVRVQPVLSELGAVLRALGRMPGPKHVVMISSGWPIEERAAANALSSLAEEAALSNATVHAFTAEEWESSPSLLNVSPRMTFDRDLLLASVESLASSTGGRAVRLAGNGEAAFKSLSGGLTGYYRLAVRPAPEDLDGKSKRIEVKVTRGGVSLVGYRKIMAAAQPAIVVAPTDAAPNAAAAPDAAAAPVDTSATVRDALRSATPMRALGLRVSSYVLHGEGAPGSVRVMVVGDVTRAADGPATAVAVLFGADGRPAKGTEQVVQIPAAGPGRVVAMLPVPPGAYVLRVAVVDREGHAGSVERRVDAWWRVAGGVETTGLVLYRSQEGRGGSLEPLLDAISAGDRLIVQVPLSAPLERGDQVTYELVRDGESDPRLRLTGNLGRTSSGALVAEGVVGPSVLPVGRYTISASLGAGAAPIPTRTFRVEAPR